MNWNFFLAPSPLKWGHLKLMKKILVILLSFLPLITSKAEKVLSENTEMKIEVFKAKGEKCPRCWKILEDKCTRCSSLI